MAVYQDAKDLNLEKKLFTGAKIQKAYHKNHDRYISREERYIPLSSSWNGILKYCNIHPNYNVNANEAFRKLQEYGNDNLDKSGSIRLTIKLNNGLNVRIKI